MLITGASGGIGNALSRVFAHAGYRVAVHYHASFDKAYALAAEINGMGGTAAAFGADLTDVQSVMDMVRDVRICLGVPGVLINNAGIALHELFTETEDEIWKRLFDVNVNSVFYVSKAVLPGMIRRKEGCILTISSMWGQVGASMEVAYSSSKAALIGFTKALAKEAGPSGIRVNAIAPGLIDTPMNETLSEDALSSVVSQTPLLRIGTPIDVANAALFLCSKEAAFITGQTLGVNGGLVI